MRLDNKKTVTSVGNSLLQFAGTAETTARGLVTELFPYIYVASQRMSSRAISNYLKTEHGVKISAASIARALREPEKHLAAMLGEVQEASQIFAAAHNASGPAMVTSKIAFEGFSERDPDFKIKDEKALLDAKFEYGEAVDALKNWFALDERFREFAQAFIVKFEKFEDGAPPRSTKARTPKTSRKNPK